MSHPHKPTDTDSGVDELEQMLAEHLIRAYYNGIDRKGYTQYEEQESIKAIKAVVSQSIKQELEWLLGGSKKGQRTGTAKDGVITYYQEEVVPVSVIEERLRRYE